MLFHQFAGHPLGLGDLAEGHTLGGYFSGFLSLLAALRGRKSAPEALCQLVTLLQPAN